MPEACPALQWSYSLILLGVMKDSAFVLTAVNSLDGLTQRRYIIGISQEGKKW